jgi:hypothetical protein
MVNKESNYRGSGLTQKCKSISSGILAPASRLRRHTEERSSSDCVVMHLKVVVNMAALAHRPILAKDDALDIGLLVKVIEA